MFQTISKAIRILLYVWFLGIVAPLSASDVREGSLLLDEEASSIIQDWLDQLAHAAGVKNKVKPYFIASRMVNAGAASGSKVYIFTAILDKCENVAQLLGVLAHEMGHIAGGHIVARDLAASQATVPAALAVILGAAAAIASGSAEPLVAGTSTSSHVFERIMLRFSRSQESASDQDAVNILKKLKWEWAIQGLYDFLRSLAKTDMSPSMDRYTLSHPPTPERLQALETRLPKHAEIPAAMEASYQRIRAKFYAYLAKPQEVLRRYPESDTSIPARYARSIAYYRLHKMNQSRENLESLIKEQPNDPYFYELKGQINLETQNIPEAKAALRKVVSLKPKSSIYRFMLAQILVDSEDRKDWQESVKLLRSLVDRDEELPLWRLLATGYGKLNEQAMATWCLAEEAYDQDDLKTAQNRANQALKQGLKDSLAKSRSHIIISQG